MMLNPEEKEDEDYVSVEQPPEANGEYQVVLSETFINWVKSNRGSNIEDLRTFLETYSDKRTQFINAIHHGVTLLIRAVGQDNIEAVDSLLGLKADPNLHHNTLITTALHQCPGKNLEIAKRLIEWGAQLEAKDHKGNTPLHIAAKQMDIDLVALLLENKANPNEQNGLGQTALHLISNFENHLALANLLLTSGANPDIPDYEGRLPILQRPQGITTAMDLESAGPSQEKEPEKASFIWRMFGY